MNGTERAELIRRADLWYDAPAERCEEGLPIGNGRMGSLIWTSPDAMKLQVNRVDVLANGPDTESFPAIHRDYGYACALFDLSLTGFGEDVFDGGTKEHLDVYNALAHLSAHGVEIDGFADDDDLFVFHVKDGRKCPQESAAKLRFLRAAEVVTGKHTAMSSFERRGDVILLKQEFREKSYSCASAVALKVVGRRTRCRLSDENNGDRRILPLDMPGFGASTEYEMKLCMPAENGEYDVYISSAASFDKCADVAAMAVEGAERAAAKGYGKLLTDHIADWNRFWEKSYIRLWGFPEAELIETHYQYYLYILRCVSRNSPFAPNFGGLLFSPRGDLRHWGCMQWWNNLSLTYNAVLPSGHGELMEPYLNMYYNAIDAYRTAARQHFGADGIYIFETAHVFGPSPIPDALEEEFRSFIMDRGPDTFEKCSPALRAYAEKGLKLESRWDFLNTEEHKPYAWCTHLFSSAAFLAYQYYLRYAYTGDMAFLREKGYPMIRGVAEFFRTYPYTTKEVYPKFPAVADGRYHIYGTSDDESNWGAYDSIGSVTAMHGIFRTAIVCAKLLGTDEDQIPVWQEMLDHLVDIPTNKRADIAENLRPFRDAPEFFIQAPGDNWPYQTTDTVGTKPLVQMDFCNVETKYADPELYRIGKNTYERLNADSDEKTGTDEMSAFPRLWAGMGDPTHLISAISGQLRCVTAAEEHCWYEANGSKAPYANRLTAREGVNAISAQRLGNAAAGLQMGLLQSTGGAPAAPAVIHVFPAWDKKNGAAFELWARDGFKVAAACDHGEITKLEITSTLGGVCRLHTPFEGGVKVISEGKTAAYFGIRVEFDTEAGKTYRIEKA